MKKNTFHLLLTVCGFVLLALILGACSPQQDATQKIKAVEPKEGAIALPEQNPSAPVPVEGTPSAGPSQTAPAQTPKSAMPSTIVAQVDDAKMTRGQLDEEVKKTLTALGDKVPPERKAETGLRIRRQLVDDFVVRTLLTREVIRQKVSVKEEDINTAIEDLKKTLPPGTTMDEMMKRNALTADKLRQEVSLGLRINKLVAMEPASKTKPTDAEIQSFYKNNPGQFKAPETVHARHILVLKTKGDNEEALKKKREKAESIRKQLVGGADFAELARTHSECPSKSNGGDLGSFSRGQMVKPFEEAAFKQKKGEIGPVVQTDFGYHIIQVLDHIPTKTLPLDGDLKTKITAYLTQQKRYAAFNSLMERLKAKASISIADKLD